MSDESAISFGKAMPAEVPTPDGSDDVVSIDSGTSCCIVEETITLSSSTSSPPIAQDRGAGSIDRAVGKTTIIHDSDAAPAEAPAGPSPRSLLRGTGPEGVDAGAAGAIRAEAVGLEAKDPERLAARMSEASGLTASAPKAGLPEALAEGRPKGLAEGSPEAGPDAVQPPQQQQQ